MNDIVTVLRQRARWCSHGNAGVPYDRTAVPWNEMTSCLSCAQELAAADEIDRLRGLVVELRPYLESDVRSGLMCEPGLTHTHDDDCEDCAWYAESVAWKARLDAGELDEVPRG